MQACYALGANNTIKIHACSALGANNAINMHVCYAPGASKHYKDVCVLEGVIWTRRSSYTTFI